ncbi:hypothetical protein GGI11_007244 [Coemansia sp. RSA 2049]|nr:hypothetical protein GGI11_007244 [Coemansia sp. RSA 2049]
MFRQIAQRGTRSVVGMPVRWYADSPATGAVQTIHARLKQDMKIAMKARDKPRLTTVKSILSDIVYAEKNQSAGASFSKDSDVDVAGIIQRGIKQRNDSIRSYQDGGRQDLVDIEEAELRILESYLPQQLSPKQIETLVRETIERLGASGIKAMGAVMREVDISPALAPKSKVAEAAKNLLSQEI